MIGDMISKIRTEKQMTKTELAKLSDINIGHLTHIEKGERNPSHKTLKRICKSLGVPYQQLMYTYGKTVSEKQSEYGLINYISYNKVLAVSNVDNFIDCPKNIASAALAIKVKDNSMDPVLALDSYAYIEFNSPLNNNDIGLFNINNDVLIRRLTYKKDKIILKADNKDYKDLELSENDTFYIIGKVLV